MKKNYSNMLTIMLTILIIGAGVGAINIYAGFRQNSRIGKIESVRMQKDRDISFESKVFYDVFQVGFEKWKEISIPMKYKNIVFGICKEYGIGTAENINGYVAGNEYIIVAKKGNVELKIYINPKDKMFEYNVISNEKYNKISPQKGIENLEKDREQKNSSLYSLMNIMLQEGIIGDIVPKAIGSVKTIMERFEENDMFIHNEKIYIPYRNNENYVVLIYDYNKSQYCGGKLFFGKEY